MIEFLEECERHQGAEEHSPTEVRDAKENYLLTRTNSQRKELLLRDLLIRVLGHYSAFS